jgi:ABC-type multidrug transport system ATPase subunit
MDGVDLLKEPSRARRILGYLPQDFGFHPSLTAAETVDYFARLKGMSERRARSRSIRLLLESVNLSSVAHSRVETFSGGMRQRLGIAQALIAKPALIIVDEPTVGLDPAERNRFHGMLSEAARDGAVVIFSTHIVSDVATLCDRLAILSRGNVLVDCALTDIHDTRRTLEEFYFDVLDRDTSHAVA